MFYSFLVQSYLFSKKYAKRDCSFFFPLSLFMLKNCKYNSLG